MPNLGKKVILKISFRNLHFIIPIEESCLFSQDKPEFIELWLVYLKYIYFVIQMGEIIMYFYLVI